MRIKEIKLTNKVLNRLGENRIKELLKEFKDAHSKYSNEHWGHFAKGVIAKYAETSEGGYWFWKGYRLKTLSDYLDEIK